MSGDIGKVTRMTDTAAVEGAELKEATTIKQAQTVAANQTFQAETKEEVVPNAMRLLKASKALLSKKIQKKKEAAEKGKPIEEVKAADEDLSEQYSREYPELDKEKLKDISKELRRICGTKPPPTRDQILKVFQDAGFTDPYLIDKIFKFAMADIPGAIEDLKPVQNSFIHENQTKITAGDNIRGIVVEAAAKGLDKPTELRNRYYDLLAHPERGCIDLYKELDSKYKNEKDIGKITRFFLHALGADLKSPSGPSIDKPELMIRIKMIRDIQAILQIPLFFKSRENLMYQSFIKENIPIPEMLTYINVAREFVNLAEQRYIAGNKILEKAARLGIQDNTQAEINVFQQMRDAVRNVAVQQVYGTFQHRDELFNAFIDALSELEDLIEEEIEEAESETIEAAKTNPIIEPALAESFIVAAPPPIEEEIKKEEKIEKKKAEEVNAEKVEKTAAEKRVESAKRSQIEPAMAKCTVVLHEAIQRSQQRQKLLENKINDIRLLSKQNLINHKKLEEKLVKEIPERLKNGDRTAILDAWLNTIEIFKALLGTEIPGSDEFKRLHDDILDEIHKLEMSLPGLALVKAEQDDFTRELSELDELLNINDKTAA